MARRRGLAATCVAAVVSALLALPAAASASAVDDLLNGVSNTVHRLTGGGGSGGGGGGGSANSDPAQPKGAIAYVPPEHGPNPHGMGTVAIGDIQQSDERPFPYDPNGGDEELVVGQSRGEQNPDGSYHGHITIASTFVTGEIIGVDTNEGESSNGPFGPINDVTCPDDGGGFTYLELCAVEANSSTDGNGSTNHFEAARVFAGIPDTLGIVDASLASSDGNISESGNCQTSHGASHLAAVDAVEVPALELSGRQPQLNGDSAVSARVLDSSTDSEACRGSAPTQQNQSGGVGIDTPLISLNEFPSADCANGVPNTQFLAFPVAGIICNADDTNGLQDDTPYGVREALDITVFPLIDGTLDGFQRLGYSVELPLIVGIVAAAESAATAPAAPPPPPPPPPPPCDNPPCHKPPPKTKRKGGHNPRLGFLHRVARAGPTLPFTGADVLTLALIGFGVMGTGLGAMALSDRRKRPA